MGHRCSGTVADLDVQDVLLGETDAVLNHIVPVPTKRIKAHQRNALPLGIDPGDNVVESGLKTLRCRSARRLVAIDGVDVDLVHVGAADDVVELVEEHSFPCPGQLCCL